MITPLYFAIKVDAENIKYFNEYEYNPTDFVELNKANLKVDDVLVTMTLTVPDPIADQFNIRRYSHWIITESLFHEKFTCVKTDEELTTRTIQVQPK